jgi:8-oxo-dGTP pyrophosphatase MutT (NUDIX family)
VFERVDHAEAGVQVPAGGIDSDEDQESVVHRELGEEVGLVATHLELLGRVDEIHSNGTPCTNWYLQAAVARSADEWLHRAGGDDEDEGLRFRCYFIPLVDAGSVIHGSQTTLLHLVHPE